MSDYASLILKHAGQASLQGMPPVPWISLRGLPRSACEHFQRWEACSNIFIDVYDRSFMQFILCDWVLRHNGEGFKILRKKIIHSGRQEILGKDTPWRFPCICAHRVNPALSLLGTGWSVVSPGSFLGSMQDSLLHAWHMHVNFAWLKDVLPRFRDNKHHGIAGITHLKQKKYRPKINLDWGTTKQCEAGPQELILATRGAFCTVTNCVGSLTSLHHQNLS